MTAFVEGRDYRWLPDGGSPWWHRLWIVRDYTRQAELLRAYRFPHPRGGDRAPVVISRGRRWNGASAGQTFREGLDSPWIMRASLVHDHCYDTATRPEGCRREDADGLFFDTLDEDGAPAWFVCLARTAAMDGGLFAHAWRRGIT